MPFLYGSSRCTAPPATSALAAELDICQFFMGLQDVVHILLGSTSALAAELDHSINASSLWVFKMYCTSLLVLVV